MTDPNQYDSGKDEKDDFAWMDSLIVVAGKDIDETLPVEPDRELDEDTEHEEPTDPDVNEIGTLTEEVDRVESEWIDLDAEFEPSVDIDLEVDDL